MTTQNQQTEQIKIMIVEDEAKLASVLTDYLASEQFLTFVISDGSKAEERFKEIQPHLLILDLMLPGKSGIEICQNLRQHTMIPIIMTTAKVEEADRLIGLDLGADDYICKPYSPREVVARVKAHLRRQNILSLSLQHTNDTHSSKSDLRIDSNELRAFWQNYDLELTLIEFKLLSTLASQPGRVFSRDRLMDNLYEDGRVVTDRTIDSHIKNLRKKLETAAITKDIIRSVYGAGYRLEL